MNSVFATIGAAASSDDRKLCYDAESIRTRHDWHRDIAALASALERRREQRWGLYASSTYDFSVGLFALWRTAKTPVIPPLNTPGVVQTLAPHVDCLLGDFAGAESILRQGCDTRQDHIDWRVAVDAELTMFTSGSSGEPKAIRKSIRQLDAEVTTLERLWAHASVTRLSSRP